MYIRHSVHELRKKIEERVKGKLNENKHNIAEDT